MACIGDRCAAGEHCQLKLLDGTPGAVEANRHCCPGPDQKMSCGKALHAFCGVAINNPVYDMHSNWCYKCSSKAPHSSLNNNIEDTQMGNNEDEGTHDNSTRHLQANNKEEMVDERDADAGPQPVNDILEKIRHNMNLETVKKKKRATLTFYKHQLENVRFIMWLYRSQFKDTCLEHELITDLNKIETDEAYSKSFIRKIQKLPLAEQKLRKEKYIYTSQTKFLKEKCLNDGGLTPHRKTIIHKNMTADTYGHYLCERRKKDGALFNPDYYPGLRSSFTYLFARYNKKISQEQFDEISDILQGVKRVANEAKQAGEGKIEDGKREVSFPLYCAFNRWCIEDGSKEAIYCRAFASKTWNLAARGDSTGKIHLPHFTWRADSYAANFAHSKDEQTGGKKAKRLPRNVYCNPFDVEADDYSATFDYIATFPELLSDPTGRFFPGSEKYVTSRFSKHLAIMLKQHKEELAKLGYTPEDIGIHSWRKGAHTYMNNGSTAGPSATSTCIRGGHAIGGSRDIYVLHARAGDTYCGRVLAGLPLHDAKFAVSYPDFSAVKEGINKDELEAAQHELDKRVNVTLESIFGKSALEHVPNLQRILRVGLASHLQHRMTLDKLYPQNSHIRSTALFTSKEVHSLKNTVKITLPWENGGLAYATGIPPHTAILAGNEEIKKLLSELLPAIEQFMDDRTMCGNLSETRMKEIVDHERRETRKQLNYITELLEKQQGVNVGSKDGAVVTHSDGYNRWIVNGIQRCLPPDWIFPTGPAVHAYQYWHHGDEVKKIVPLKMLKRSDLNFFTDDKKRYLRNFEEVKQLFQILDNEAKSKGLLKENMSRSDTMDVYKKCKGVFGIPELTDKGRKRNFVKLAWGTIVRERKRLKNTAQEGGTKEEEENRANGNSDVLAMQEGNEEEKEDHEVDEATSLLEDSCLYNLTSV